jgi:hypothetical protein
MGHCASKKDYGFNEEAGREDWHKRKLRISGSMIYL